MIKAQNTRTVRCQFAFSDDDGNRKEATIRVHYRMSSKTREEILAKKDDLTEAARAAMIIIGLPDLTDDKDQPVKPFGNVALFEGMDADNLDRMQLAIGQDFSPKATSVTPSNAGSSPVEEGNPQTTST